MNKATMRQNTDPLNVKKCRKYDGCYLISMILDHEMSEEEYRFEISRVCGQCKDYEEASMGLKEELEAKDIYQGRGVYLLIMRDEWNKIWKPYMEKK